MATAGPNRPPVRVLVVGAVDAPSERVPDWLVVESAAGKGAAVEALSAGGVDCVVSTQRLDDGTGLDLLEAVRESHPDLPFFLLPADGDERLAGAAVAADATEYVPRSEDVTLATLADRVADRVAEYRERERRRSMLAQTQRRSRTVIDNFPDGAVVAFDGDLRYTVAGGEGMDDVDLAPVDLEGQRVDEALPGDIADVLEPHYRATVEGEPQTFRLAYGGRTYRFRSVPLREADGEVVGGVAFSQDITDQAERERELERRARQQAIVARLAERALEGVPLDGLFDDAVAAVADVLDNDYCKVLDLSPEGDELLLRAGVGWDEGYVGRATVGTERDSQAGYTLLSEEPVVVDDLETETRFSGPDLLVDHDVTSGISVVIGTPDDPWGVLGTHDTERREYADHDVTFVGNVATLLATALDRADHERALERQHRRLVALNDINSLVHGISESAFELSSREEIESLVCRQLAESESYRFAWIGALEDGEVHATTECGVEGYLDGSTLAVYEPPGENGPTVRAHLTGEMQVVQDVDTDPRYEPWRDHAREHGFRASAAIPIAYGGEVHGTVNVYADRPEAFDAEERGALRRLGSIIAHAFQSVERDRKLDIERERLEFMNRLLRHDLLNSLNVVAARLNFLEGHVDAEVTDHLETASERTRDMVDFVETIRRVMRAIGRGEPHETRPVDISAELTSRVEHARDAYPEARFDVAPLPDVEVRADQLLGKVLDNVLVNAVQHNDKEVPRVWVDAAVERDEVAVSVADNGPGIPEDQRPRLFERGTTGFVNPGSGFGLFLVRELVRSYGGSLNIEDNDPEGTVFRLRLPRFDASSASVETREPGRQSGN